MSDSTTSTGRWSQPVPVSTAFTEEQKQRAQALRIAREVIEEKEAAKGPMTPGGLTLNAAYLIETAQWIIDGSRPGDLATLALTEGVTDGD